MKGLLVWAHSYCRSVLGFYRGLGEAWNVPLKVCIWKENAALRTNVGFTENEFSDMDISFIGNDYCKAKKVLCKHASWHQLFCAYQSVKIYQDLIIEAKGMGCCIAVASEAPCNMTPGIKGLIKEIYLSFVLPNKIKKQISCADFIINFSGDNLLPLMRLGWNKARIIPCGYYSPAIIGSKRVKRTRETWEDFRILLTGIHQWHRSPFVLLKALNILNKKGLKFECDITQKGPLFTKMKSYVDKHKMGNVHLLGFLPMEDLISKYENCSVYIGAGNNEPWGMRLNDALMCGAPMIVNKGMGGYKMVKDYNCGLVFERNNYRELAREIEMLMRNEHLYLEKAEAAYIAAEKITPSVKAAEIVSVIKNRFPNWN